MKRRVIDRIQDRAWREVGRMLVIKPAIQKAEAASLADSSSISANMPWAEICKAYSHGHLDSRHFRRTSAVRDIVETVGPVDGRFYAKRIFEWEPGFLSHPQVAQIDAWGNPIRWPGCLLGTPSSFSPTTLRYLATALWLRRQNYITRGSEVVEIGVGFGGLAAMNALVASAATILVDLPQVEQAAMRMMHENDLAKHCRPSAERADIPAPLVVSNYAFTELNSAIQKIYFDRYLKNAEHAVIISNSAIFADRIRGRSDEDLVKWFRSEGLPAKLETTNELLAPGDALCRVSMIHW